MSERHMHTVAAIALGIILAARAPAYALDPALDVSQYAHTAWKIRDGFTRGAIRAIAQTPDGYLWLGTEFGVLRFDGVRNVAWRPPPGQSLPSNDIWSLLVARDGALWIGTGKGLARWKDGTLTRYPELSGFIVQKLLEDHEGTMWASGSAVPAGRLCAVLRDAVRCDGEDGSLSYGVLGLYEDRKGNLWAASPGRLWRWKPGPPTLFPMPAEETAIQGLDEDRDGTLLIGTRAGLRRFVDGRIEPYPLSGPSQSLSGSRVLRDRDGGLWMTNLDRGVLHLHQGRTDVFNQADGLSGDDTYAIFEDREGSIWIATAGGLDRFRAYAVPTLSAKQGLSNGLVASVLASTDGSLWLATVEGLKRWHQGQVRAVVAEGLGQSRVDSLFEDSRGRIWVSGRAGFGYLENDRFILVPVPRFLARSIAEDTQSRLWINDQERGLLQISAGTDVERIPWTAMGHQDFATALIADRLRGGLWLGFWDGGVVYFKDGQVRASYTGRDGLGEGHVGGFHADPDGTLWVATEGGLSRLKDGRVATLTSSSGLPCDSVQWVIEDDAHAFWLSLACGLARVARADVDAWAADPTRKIAATLFDISDGVRAKTLPGSYSPQVAKSRDGKLWFVPGDGVSVIDPGHLPYNALPPPVHVEQVVADRTAYDLATADEHLRLPPLTRDLQIEYTALSLVSPDKVRFRYRLEGHDADWQDVGTRRQAFYTDLPPGNYRFRVMASNNSGVWNEAGTSIDFAIAPAYYQTAWFQALLAGTFLMVLAALYRLRVGQVARQYNARVEARVNERTRIARDLHDTLLQSFQGVLLKFHAVSYKLGDHREAREELEAAIEQARHAITEGRDAVQGLRASTLPGNDLARAIITFGEELAVANGGERAELQVQVEGASRDLASLVHDDVYRIACEALRNAYTHADARHIEVEIHYDHRQLRLRIRDDGKGVDSGVLRQGARAGHYGLPGMHERASAIGGTLTVWSEVHSGTEVELVVPGAVAYAPASAARSSTLAGSGA